MGSNRGRRCSEPTIVDRVVREWVPWEPMDGSHLLQSLNTAQREAVTAPECTLLVLAGAGSGKTRVLVHRMAWLVETGAASLSGLLAVTFTNKAANQMRTRIESLLGYPASGLWIGTFHGLAHRMLRQHHLEAGLPEQFQIIDSDDQLRLVRRVLKTLDLDEAKWTPRQAQWFINARKDEGVRASHIPDQADPVARQWARIYATYEQTCNRSGIVDFAELLLRSVELLRDHPTVLDRFRARFRHVLVDEFQDTNEIQYAWLRLLAGTESPVFAVGDDDQSIYGWRGARVENLQRLQKDFPGTRIVRLEQNYRSTANILHAANALIRRNPGRLGKELWTEGRDGAPLRLFEAYNEVDEARFVADTVARHATEGGLYRECAVLYRSNAQSRILEETLIAQRLPYRIHGGLRFFERQEIKDALGYLRLATHADDDAAFLRIVNQPPRGIGDKTIDDLRRLAHDDNVSLNQAAARAIDGHRLAGRARSAVAGFLQLRHELEVHLKDLDLPAQLQWVIERSGLAEHYRNEKHERAEARLENLAELVDAARAFQIELTASAELEDDPVGAFLAHAALEAGEGGVESDTDAVQLMTLHAAKGLEFPIVFIVGLEEGVFPGARSLDEPGKLEEERRLAYVGMTRAERELYLSYAESRRLYGRETRNRPSRFLTEIPAQALDPVRKARAVRSGLGASPPVAALLQQEQQGFAMGARVRHGKFGEGVITGFEGSGASARVQVRFERAGSKWLVLSFARLESA
jgi:DNA helicase-2/ATP-dependent DNA helicase PcrA